MKEKIDTQFLYLLIEGQFDDKSVCHLSCLTQNNGIDESRYKIQERLKQEGIKKCRLLEVGVVNSNEIDMINYENFHANDIRFGLIRPELINKSNYNFVNPQGVIISSHSLINRNKISLSYSYLEDNYSTFSLVIVPDIDTIEKTVDIICFNILPKINFLGVYVDGGYDNKNVDYDVAWVKTGNKYQLIDFLKENKLNLFENGFLAIEMGEKQSNNRFRITKTKEIIFWTDSIEQFVIINDRLNDLGYIFKDKIISTGEDYSHFKYRKKGSLDMNNLIGFLRYYDFVEHRFD